MLLRGDAGGLPALISAPSFQAPPHPAAIPSCCFPPCSGGGAKDLRKDRAQHVHDAASDGVGAVNDGQADSQGRFAPTRPTATIVTVSWQLI